MYLLNNIHNTDIPLTGKTFIKPNTTVQALAKGISCLKEWKGYTKSLKHLSKLYLRNKSGGSRWLIFPVGGQDCTGLVVTAKTVNTGLYKNKPELGVTVLPESDKEKDTLGMFSNQSNWLYEALYKDVDNETEKWW